MGYPWARREIIKDQWVGGGGGLPPEICRSLSSRMFAKLINTNIEGELSDCLLYYISATLAIQ